ncbi:MAG: ATP-dependent helicase [Chloroflexota bacterium]
MDILEVLNPEQRQAVEAVEGPLLVLAGPGSGKTRVITHRIAHLIRNCRVSPYNIMAVTFTNKAAREMKERLDALTPGALASLTIGTFHSVCSRILRRDAGAIGVDSHFVIYDDGDQLSIVKKVLRDLNLDEKQHSPRAILAGISKAKSELIGPLQYAEYTTSYWEEIVLRVYRAYQEDLAQKHAVDFDDLIMTTVRLFRERPDILARYQDRYHHVLVDEFQDTNIAQYSLLRQVAGKHHNLCVVGDEDQSVYSWRQADLRNILNFEYDYPGAKVIVLERNYRSTQNILKAATSVISANELRKDKRLWTANGAGKPLTVFEAYNEREEARYIINEIERLLSRNEVRLSECAVMYRTNAQSRALEEGFLRNKLPYRLVGATRFYERKEIKDTLAFMRFIFNPYDDASFLRMLDAVGHGIGAKTIQGLESWAKTMGLPLFGAIVLLKDGPEAVAEYLPDVEVGALDKAPKAPFATRTELLLTGFAALPLKLLDAGRRLDALALLEYILKETGLGEQILDGTEEGEERWKNVKELASVAGDYAGLDAATSLETFLEAVALVSEQDNLGEGVDAVTLITLHAAKGLEFKAVFIAGVEEGLCPHSRSVDDPRQMEEERRLFYVGMTRAKEHLYLVYAFRRTLYGGSMPGTPSRFLADIPDNLVQGRDTPPPASPQPVAVPRPVAARPAAKAARGAGSYRAGERVRHPVFGEGLVVSSEARGEDEEVTVVFAGAGLKRLSLAFANLQRL